MKPVWLLPIFAFLVLGTMPYRIADAPRAKARDIVDPYAISAAMSGASVDSLKRLAWVESNGGRNLAHVNPVDAGWYGLHERDDYHAERARLYGDYSATDPIEAGRVAGKILMDHYAALGSMELAYTAYHRGRAWTIANGLDLAYLARIEECGNEARI